MSPPDPSGYVYGRVPALDGIRALAILAVMLYHSKLPFFEGGFIGVEIFFTLSGFLITTLLLQEYDATGRLNFTNFFARRAIRLLPALLLFLTSLVILSAIFLEGARLKENIVGSASALFYTTNWASGTNVDFLQSQAFLRHTWTLSIEAHFYLIWPFLLVGLLQTVRSRRKIIGITLVVALLAWILRLIMTYRGGPYIVFFNLLDTRADAILIGCGLGLACSANILHGEWAARALKPMLRCLTPLFIVILALGISKVRWPGSSWHYLLYFAAELSTAVLILEVMVFRTSGVKRVLEFRPLVWIGTVSYGLYLWHVPIFRFLEVWGYPVWLASVTGCMLTFMTASLSYYLLERPLLKRKRRFQQVAPAVGLTIDRRF